MPELVAWLTLTAALTIPATLYMRWRVRMWRQRQARIIARRHLRLEAHQAMARQARLHTTTVPS